MGKQVLLSLARNKETEKILSAGRAWMTFQSQLLESVEPEAKFSVFPVTAVTMKGHVLCMLLTRNHFTELGKECGENVWGTQLHRCLLHAEAPRQFIA